MRRSSEYNASFTDMLFNILLGVLVMFILVLLLVNPSKTDTNNKKFAYYIVEMIWDPEIDCDIDLWVRDPRENVIYFSNRDEDVSHLERDDLGNKNDTAELINGQVVVVPENKEIWTLRGALYGKFTVNTHAYNCRVNDIMQPVGSTINVPVKVNLIQLQPKYDMVYQVELVMKKVWEEQTAFSFELSKDMKAVAFSRDSEPFAVAQLGQRTTGIPLPP